VANTFAQSYLELTTSQLIESQTAVRDTYTQRLAEIRAQLITLRAEARRQGGDQRAETRATIGSLTDRQADLRVALLLTDDPAATNPVGGEILQRAVLPLARSQPQPVRGALLGAVLGLVVGTLIAYLRDARDRARTVRA
jgi:uncharacterized protein involved in exopolysaccharide biosynthesis